jgi:hypothetical protein
MNKRQQNTCAMAGAESQRIIYDQLGLARGQRHIPITIGTTRHQSYGKSQIATSSKVIT